MEDNSITPEYIKSLTSFTDEYLCKISDNLYKIKFLSFRVRDMDSGYTLFEVHDDEVEDNTEQDQNGETTDKNDTRSIRYHLGSEFLELKSLATSLKFSVGETPVKNLIMIERHYFKTTLVKSFEFKFDFCMPNTVNTWETIYSLPELDENIKKEMIDAPWETRSDSFYFVDNKLIMHHKAYYNYSD